MTTDTQHQSTPNVQSAPDGQSGPNGQSGRDALVARTDALAERLAGEASRRDRDGVLPPELFPELRSTGLTTALVPAELGGGGCSFAETGALLRRLGRSDGAAAVALSMHTHLVAAQVWRHHRGLPGAAATLTKVAGGAVLISTGASDWLGSNGRVTRVEGGYRVTARKSPASGCEAGQVLVTSARWDDAPDGAQVLHCAIGLNAPGVRIEPTWDTLGLRASGSHTVVLDDVFVADEAVSLIRPADVWHPVWNTVLGVALPLIMAAYLGIADAALDLAVEACSSRRGSTAPLGEVINAHTAAADSVDAMLASARDLRFDATDAHAALTLSRKTVAAEAAIATVRTALEVVGGSGFQRSHPLERLFRDVHGCLFHPLPRARQWELSANVALGRPPVG